MQDADRQREAVVRHFETVSAEWGTHYQGTLREISDLDLVGRREAATTFLNCIRNECTGLRNECTSLRNECTGLLTVLDVGCGSGDVLPALDAGAWRIYGIDLVEAMVRNAARQLPSGHFGVADAVRIPFQAESMDVVTCLGVLEYIPDWAAALAAIRSVLKPGGHLIVSFPNRQSLFRRLGHVESRVVKRIRSLTSRNGRQRPRAAYERHEWTTRESRRALERDGLIVRDARFMTYGLKGRLGDRSRINLAIASKLRGRLTGDSLVARTFAWTTVYWCVKAPSKPAVRQTW